LNRTVVLHTPCLETGMYPKCAKAKGKCELEDVVIGELTIVAGSVIGSEWQQPRLCTLYTHVWDQDHIMETCITPSLIVVADNLGFPIRPLKIFGVADEKAFKANQQGGIWVKCPGHKTQVNGCSRYFECGRCISESKKKTTLTKPMPTRKTTRINLLAPIRMDRRPSKKPKNESTKNIAENTKNNINSGD